MKKLLIAAVAVLAVASISIAVTSQNAVGYAKEGGPDAGKFEIISINVLGNGNTVGIQNAIKNTEDLNATTSLDSADQIFIWTGLGYDQYGFFAGASNNYWMSAGDVGWQKAANTGGPETNAVIARGDSVWFRTGTGGAVADLMSLGEVPNDGTYDVGLFEGFTLVAYPYSSTINLQDLSISNSTASTDLDAADQIFVWTGLGYDQYGFFAGTTDYWLDAGDVGWQKAGSASPATDADLDLGKGVWYKSADGAKTIGFTQNYTLD
jgi:hypothetical protein